MSQEIINSRFDYNGLDEGTRVFVKVKTEAIKECIKHSAEEIIAIGQYLSEVKEKLGHGKFLLWIKEEFGMSEKSANRFMQVAERFGADPNPSRVTDLGARVLYELAAPSTSDSIIEKVESGEIQPNLEAIKEAKRAEEAERKLQEMEAQKKAVEDRLQKMWDLKESYQEEAEEAKTELEDLRLEVEEIRRQYDEAKNNYAGRIYDLETQVESMEEVEPIVRVEYKDTEETTALLEDLKSRYHRLENLLQDRQQQIDEITTYRDNLAKERKRLEDELNAITTEQERLRIEMESGVRKKWAKINETFDKAMKTIAQQWINPIDVQQVFDHRDWAKFEYLRSQALRFVQELDNLKSIVDTQFIDSTVEGTTQCIDEFTPV